MDSLLLVSLFSLGVMIGISIGIRMRRLEDHRKTCEDIVKKLL